MSPQKRKRITWRRPDDHSRPNLEQRAPERGAMSMPTEDDYFRDDDALYADRRALRCTEDPAERAAILDQEAVATEARAAIHRTVFGDDPEAHDAGYHPEQWLAFSARLLRIIANGERGRATGCLAVTGDALDTEPVRLALWLYSSGAEWERIRHLLCEAWRPLVGGQAVESVATIPDGR